MEGIYALDRELMSLLKAHLPESSDSKRYTILSHTVNFSYLSLGLKPTDIYQLYGFSDVASFVYEEYEKDFHTFAFIPKDFIILDKSHRLFRESKMRPRDEKHAKEIAYFTAFLAQKLPYKLIAKSSNFMLFANTDSTHSHILNPKDYIKIK